MSFKVTPLDFATLRGRKAEFTELSRLYTPPPELLPSPHHSFIPGLKPTFSASPSHCSLPILLQDLLHGLPGLFSDTSKHPFVTF